MTITYTFKIKGKLHQYKAIDEAILITQYIRNKCIRLWMDSKDLNEKVNQNSLRKYALDLRKSILTKEYTYKLNSHACQASSERAWIAINKFYSNCKKGLKGKKGFPKFSKNTRSVEYKQSGWKLDANHITFTDKLNISRVKLLGTKMIPLNELNLIKRVRLLKLADGYYCQFVVDKVREFNFSKTNNSIGLDMGLIKFYTDSNGESISIQKFARKSSKKIKKLNKNLSKKQKGSNRRKKAKILLAKAHLKISRKRKDFASKTARCVVSQNDIISIEKLNIKGLVRSKLAKSIYDAAWNQFKYWLNYYCSSDHKTLIEVDPKFTSQDCSNCGFRKKKSLSERVHNCENCSCTLDRDHNAAINILNKGLIKIGLRD